MHPVSPEYSGHVLYVAGVHTTLVQNVKTLLGGEPFWIKDREDVLHSLLEVVFAQRSKQDYIDVELARVYHRCAANPKEWQLLQEYHNQAINTLICLIADHIQYTPNYLLHDYRLLNDEWLAVGFRELEYSCTTVTVDTETPVLPEDL